MRLDPTLVKALVKFRRNRRAWSSLLILAAAFFLSLGAELLCNQNPYVLRFEGTTYFPLFKFYSGSTFGEETFAEVDYKELRQSERFKKSGGWMIFPPVPFSSNESMKNLPMPPPTKPSKSNFLGTDDRGRDLLTRLVYGFRNSMLFALATWVFIVIFAYAVGATQGYWGGRYDLTVGRLTEIWSALPMLYVILFLLSVFPASLWLLGLIWVAFGWIGLASYIRAEVLRVRRMDYITSARTLGLGTPRILWRHVFPNTLTPILTFSPFILSAAVGSLAALDYLGLGLPPPAASWGELLRQGKENLQSWWLVLFPFLSLFLTLLLLNFVGEGLRSAFDARSTD